MLELSYQTSLATKIASVLPEYRFSEPLGELIRNLKDNEAKYLYKLCTNRHKDELKQFIEAYI